MIFKTGKYTVKVGPDSHSGYYFVVHNGNGDCLQSGNKNSEVIDRLIRENANIKTITQLLLEPVYLAGCDAPKSSKMNIKAMVALDVLRTQFPNYEDFLID